MAGLFGMFDPTREGPGVSKNAPQKKRFFLFFEIYFRKFSKIILLNIIYFLVCIPLVTIGPATAAMTYCMRNFAREEHADLSDFFDQFKKNFWQGLAIGTILSVSFGIVIFGLFFYFALYQAGNFLGLVGFCLCVTAAFVLLFMSYYIYMLMVTFKMTIRQLLKNSFLFSFIGLGRNIITTIILVFVYGWFLICGILQLILPLYTDFVPSLSSACLAFTMYIFFIPSLGSFVTNFNIYPCVKQVLIDPAMKELEEQRAQQEKIFEDQDFDEE